MIILGFRFAISTIIILLLPGGFAFSQADYWIPLNTPPHGSIKTVRCRYDQVLFSSDSGLFRSTDHGSTWNQIHVGSAGAKVGAFAWDSSGTLFVWTDDRFIYRSENADSWIQIGQTPFVIDRLEIDAGERMYVHAYEWPIEHLDRSLDSCKTFTIVRYRTTFGGLVDWVLTPRGDLVDAETDRYGNMGSLYRSTDHGDTWEPAGYYVVPNMIVTVSVTPWGELFAGSTEFSVVGINGVVARSTDDGNTWTPLGVGWPYADVMAIAANSANAIFVGTSNGVFRSIDIGSSWTDLSSGLASTEIRLLAIDDDDFVYLTAYNSDLLYRSNARTTGVQDFGELPSRFRLQQNCPNPFNPTTAIHYSLPVPSNVSLRIFNVLGQNVATLVDGRREAGDESAEWDASGFASGVYFYRIEATSTSDPSKRFTEVRKMLLVR